MKFEIKLIALAIALASLLAGCRFAVEHFKDQGRAEVQAQWNVDKLARAAALKKITNQLRETEQAYAVQLSKAQNEFTEKTRQINADADRARATANSLRNDLTAARARLSGTSPAACAAVTHYASTLTNVFEQCTERYRAVAESADRHAADAKMIWSAWPRVQTSAQ